MPESTTSSTSTSFGGALIEANNEQVLGVARSQALASAYQGLAHSLNLLMLNDAQAHQAFAALEAAIVGSTIKLVIDGQHTSSSSSPATTEASNG